MKRLIEKAFEESWINDYYHGNYKCHARVGFYAGAEWQAEQSPWISVKDRLPEEDGYYLITDGNFIVTAYFFKDWKKFAQYKRYPHPFYGDGVIKLYMPIPKFN